MGRENCNGARKNASSAPKTKEEFSLEVAEMDNLNPKQESMNPYKRSKKASGKTY
ncbi:hypothetical protein MHH81_11300 [Psychrobacillus sp. FSL H8-0484]|uniref:hypothetical protein n=1 Tax=Psychrobacillus sp. FSL H8-0484 TaxID=2921390 RepID=UPI0030FA8F08